MEQSSFFSDSDLASLFDELDDTCFDIDENEEKEMSASERRYNEIIKKHRD